MDFLSGMVRAMIEPPKNEVIKGDGFYVSYNPAPSWGGEAGEETALVTQPAEGRGKFFILNGDFREEYRAALPNGYAACFAIFEANKANHRSEWSEDGCD